jgi:serine/threonine-protein kinase
VNLKEMIKTKRWIKIEPLTKGWSKDVKYYVEDIEKRKFLLRISENSAYDKKLEHFKLLKEVNKLGYNTPIPY